MEELISLSTRLVVMADRGRQMLQDVYGASPSKIDLIPHGIADVGFVDPTYFKDQFQVEGRTVLLTFGLLSPNKGIEYVLNALPAILAEFPDVVYIVLGATHPNELRNHGEAYRLEPGDTGHAEQAGEARHLLQPVRRRGKPEGIYGGRRSVHHAVSECSPDHFRHTGLRLRLRKGSGFDTLLARGGTAGRRPRRAGSVCRFRAPWQIPSSPCYATTRAAITCAKMPTSWGEK